MQNAGMASGLAKAMGKMATVGLAPAIFGPLMNISGSVLASYWHRKPVGGETAKEKNIEASVLLKELKSTDENIYFTQSFVYNNTTKQQNSVKRRLVRCSEQIGKKDIPYEIQFKILCSGTGSYCLSNVKTVLSAEQ
jgi:hypothetical protein